MMEKNDLFTIRKPLGEICETPDKIISVYSLDQHVWADDNSKKSQKERLPELQTIEEFEFDPVRHFLVDVLKLLAAPYHRERRDNPIGQGYWIQADFGSGKSHLLCVLSALALGNQQAWEILKSKEEKAGRGKRESLYQFWENGLSAKSSNGSRGIFVVVKTLVGSGGDMAGDSSKKGKTLVEIILDEVKEQLYTELGKNISLFPYEQLADHFFKNDRNRFRKELVSFLHDPHYFEEDEYEEVDDFITTIEKNPNPKTKFDYGNKLWRFYTDYLKVTPIIDLEPEQVLKHMVEAILAEGYSGVLLVLDEVSLFMRDRVDQRSADESTLTVLSNRLTRAHNLPIWTICAAQQALESEMGVKNLIADDRLKLVTLLEGKMDYFDIVLSRVRKIKDMTAINNYYEYYRKGFSWPNSLTLEEFTHFFPFHKPALEVLKNITYELTTARSAIHFMHQTLRYQIKHQGTELIRLWELFEDTVKYEEDPSGVHPGISAIKTKKDTDYQTYERCKAHVESTVSGTLQFNQDKAIKILQTLFLYYISKTEKKGINSERIANEVLIPREPDSNPTDNNQHYENLAEHLAKELAEIKASATEDNKNLYSFEPTLSGINPNAEFKKARTVVEESEKLQDEAWQKLLRLSNWTETAASLRFNFTRPDQNSIFCNVTSMRNSPTSFTRGYSTESTEINWRGRSIKGMIIIDDLAKGSGGIVPIFRANIDESDNDFVIVIGTKHTTQDIVEKILCKSNEPRLIIWNPAEMTTEEEGKFYDFAAYFKLINDWKEKTTEDARSIMSWIADALKTSIGKHLNIINNVYSRGRIDSLEKHEVPFVLAGELETQIIPPIVDSVLSGVYESKTIQFDTNLFRKEEGIKVINGIIKYGHVLQDTQMKDRSAVQNFGKGLMLIKPGKQTENTLDTSGNVFVKDIYAYIEENSETHESIAVETIYKNFMGISGKKRYGLQRVLVQIYLLCLVRERKIRIKLAQRRGLGADPLDYTTIEGIDFNSSLLDSMQFIELIRKPDNWEIVSPYLEKLLNGDIAEKADEQFINKMIQELVGFWNKWQSLSKEIETRLSELFEFLSIPNPYKQIIEQMTRLFDFELTSGSEIDSIMHALDEVFEYQTRTRKSALQSEVDDLSNRFKTYKNLERLVAYERDLRVLKLYCDLEFPDDNTFLRVKDAQERLRNKLQSFDQYVNSEAKLKTELIGNDSLSQTNSGTLSYMINEYTSIYCSRHSTLNHETTRHRGLIRQFITCDELKALERLESIRAFQPKTVAILLEELDCCYSEIFYCNDPSHHSIVQDLKDRPWHKCGLKLESADLLLHEAKNCFEKARHAFDSIFEQKLSVLLDPSTRDRIKTSSNDPLAALILSCKDIPDLRANFLPKVLEDPSCIDKISSFLKRVRTIPVRLTDFKLSSKSCPTDQLPQIVNEFRSFLESKLTQNLDEGDSITFFQFE